MTTGAWTALGDELGTTRQEAIDGAGNEHHLTVAAVDALFTALAQTLRADRVTNPLVDPTLLLIDMDPMPAALLVRDLGLDADALATVARQLVEREQVALDQPGGAHGGPRAADVLFDAMLHTPGAPTEYVVHTIDDPHLVLEAPSDRVLAHQLVAAATASTNASPGQLAVVMPVLIRWILGATNRSSSLVYDDRLPLTLADLIGPHLLDVLRAGPGAYSLTEHERRAIEHMIAGDHEALDHLLAANTVHVSAFVDAASDGPIADAVERIAAVRDLAALLAIVDSMQVHQRVATAERLRNDWSAMWTTLGYLVGVIPLPNIWSTVAGGAVTALHHTLDMAGVGPRSVGDARVEALGSFDTVTTTAAAMVVAATFDGMVATGRIPHGAPPPPQPDLDATDVGAAYDAAFTGWLSSNDLADDVLFELAETKQTIASTHEAEADATDRRLG